MGEGAKIVIAHWSQGTSYVFIFIEESSRGVIMQTSGYHSRSSHPQQQIFMNADVWHSWHLRTDDEVVMVTATWSDIVPSPFQLLRIP